MSDAMKALAAALSLVQSEVSSEAAGKSEKVIEVLQGVAVSLGELLGAAERSLAGSGEREAELRSSIAGVKDSLGGIHTAMSEFVGLAERAQKLNAEAIAAISFPAPQVHFEPTIQVPAQPLSVEVKAGDQHVHVPTERVELTVTAGENHVHVPEPQVKVIPTATWKAINAEFKYQGDRLIGARITRE